MTPRKLLSAATRQLQDCSCATPRLDAELLLCHSLHCSRSWLIAHADDQLDDAICKAFERLLKRRKQRQPVAYITGEKEFWSRVFAVNSDVLIPRPETEHLIDAMLQEFPDRNAAYRFCDIGTGSGCIAVTLACEFPQARITASDISPQALVVAQKNAAKHNVAKRIEWREGDMLAALATTDGPFDAMISNPPYVGYAEMETLEPELAFEPRHALTDEADGLRYLVCLLEHTAEWLK
ncbi:MAG: peptide chain release factor N(5)-glutamine methyltransferase, partial [Mariprofundaceae bacterium]|nr:peptide chain release factor N(5)-glutamine methyltransferase [Mariprofundaceae bacterium]